MSVSEVKVVAEEKFGELLAAVRKAQADVMVFLEEKEQAALNQVNSIKTHLEHRSLEMEKSKQELERLAAISNTVLFLEVRRLGEQGTLEASGLRHTCKWDCLIIQGTVKAGEWGLDSSENSNPGGIDREEEMLEGGSSSRCCMYQIEKACAKTGV